MAWTLEELSYRVLPRVAAGKALASSEWRTLRAAAETLLSGCPVPVTPERAADNVERFLIAGRSRRAFRVRALLTVIEFATVPEYGGRFSQLSPGVRRRVVEDRFMGGKHVWGLCAKVRLLVMMGAYGDEAAHRAVGAVPVAERASIRRRLEVTKPTTKPTPSAAARDTRELASAGA